MANYYIFLMLLVISVNFANSNKTISQLHILFRHGDRTPIATYKNDPYIDYNWPGGWGQLTNLGKLHLYQLGLKIREIYKDFIPDTYSKDNVEILSSYRERCLMSAEVLLAGLFPPKGDQIWNKNLLWQPIPVKYLPPEQDNMLSMRRACLKYDLELSTILLDDEYRKIDEENAELYKFLTYNTGVPMFNIWEIELLYNTLEIEKSNNLTLPEWTKQVSFDKLKTLAAQSLASFTHTTYMKRMKGGVWINRTIDCMKNKQAPSLYLYSAHDITIVGILRALGVVEDKLNPRFGANIIIELYDDSEVKMFYRNQFDYDAEELSLASCQSPCLLADFQTALESILPKNYDDECVL